MRLHIAGDQRQGQPQPGPQVVRPAAAAQPLAAWGSSASAATACADRRPPANTFCAQFVGHTVDTALAKCHAALRGTRPEVGMRLPRWTTSRTAPCCVHATLPSQSRSLSSQSDPRLQRSPASLTLQRRQVCRFESFDVCVQGILICCCRQWPSSLVRIATTEAL